VTLFDGVVVGIVAEEEVRTLEGVVIPAGMAVTVAGPRLRIEFGWSTQAAPVKLGDRFTVDVARSTMQPIVPKPPATS
jgi:hypothetical protein